MPAVTSNATTDRLEGYARARGLDLGIVKSRDNAAGVFFVVAIDRTPVTHWISLGWTADEAREQIARWND